MNAEAMNAVNLVAGSALDPDGAKQRFACLAAPLCSWEEEIEDEAYLPAQAERLTEPSRKETSVLLAEVARHCAAITRPLIEKHRFTPQPKATLVAAGRAAAKGVPGRTRLLGKMGHSYPGDRATFRALAAIAPAEDRPLLDRMTAQKVEAVAFAGGAGKGRSGPHRAASGLSVQPGRSASCGASGR
ncbi:MAG: hypothetical protein AAGC92_07105 [Pseudomonadota bacterium]